MALENPFSDLAQKQNDFIAWVVGKLQDHENRLDDIVIAADMLTNTTSTKSQEHEARLDALARQLKESREASFSGKAPSALKSVVAGAMKREVKVRLNSEAEDLEAEMKAASTPVEVAPHIEQTRQEAMERSDARTQMPLNGTGSLESIDLPETLTQAIETTTVSQSPGNNARSRRTCMIPKFEDILNEPDDVDEVPTVDSAPFLPDVAIEKRPETSEESTTAKVSIVSALQAAKNTCAPGNGSRGDESPGNASPRSFTSTRGRALTDQVDFDKYPPGAYILSAGVVVTDGCQSKTSVGRLHEGDVVMVIQVAVDQQHRIRAEIEEPKGWINLVNAATEQVYAEKANECSHCKKMKVKGTEVDGQWTCVECRQSSRSTRRMARKCDSCSQSAFVGRPDPASGSWYCNACWEHWK